MGIAVVGRAGSRATALGALGAAGLAFLLADAQQVTAQRVAPPIQYSVSFDNAAHHEARITVEFPAVRGPLEVRMSRTSPGRYALHEFAKNVYDVQFEDGDGDPLDATRPNLHEWRIAEHDGTVRMHYTLFGDQRDGTYAAIGPDGAMLNAPASFAWGRGLENRAAEVSFDLPTGWRVASQLVAEGQGVWSAPDLAYFLDSPILVGDLDVRSWPVEWKGETATIHFAVAHDSPAEELDRYIEWVKSVVLEEIAVYDDIPDFDYGAYTFLASYLPWSDSDGMEHRNSTVLTFPGRLPDNGLRVLGTVAHEFFHAWNIERIRPASLEPFDFEAANVSRELWFGEGFTSYYDDLVIARAGIIDEGAFAARMGGLVNTVTNSAGRRLRSPAEMSMRAPFVDAAVSVDPQNQGNTFISYYTWGAALGLALDLAIRDAFPGKTLDDVMRRMWEVHGKPFVPYDVASVEAAVAIVTSESFASDFFERYVRGTDVPDYAGLLETVGFELGRSNTAMLAFEPLAFEDGGARVRAYPSVWSPLYEADVSRGDVIAQVEGTSIRSADDLRRAIGERPAGSTVTARIVGRLGWRDVSIVLAADPRVTVGVSTSASSSAIARRAEWLSTRAATTSGGSSGEGSDNGTGATPVAMSTTASDIAERPSVDARPVRNTKPVLEPNGRVVEAFLTEYRRRTGSLSTEGRAEALDRRIGQANLSLADKVDAFRRLAPPRDATSGREELRLERLLLSVDATDLSLFKFELEYDADAKDMEEYLFHDIDSERIRGQLLAHLGVAPPAGLKVLTDVDDTLYPNILDQRYPKKVAYPGVVEFYSALSREPWRHDGTVVTALSARPDPISGEVERQSLRGLAALTQGRLRPSGLSGALVSSAAGTLQTIVRAAVDSLGALDDFVPHGQERAIGEVKYRNFTRFAAAYPEYRYVFIGDSGQADALTAQRMIETTSAAGTRVVTTFIHDLRTDAADTRSTSPSFESLPKGLVVNSESMHGRGVITFRNYIDAAVQARRHAATLGDLISAPALAAITLAALTEFAELDFGELVDQAARLRDQYRADAQAALELLEPSHSPEELGEISRLLRSRFAL